MAKGESREEISSQEFMQVLQKGGIKMKRLKVGGHSKLDDIELKWTNLPKNVLLGPLVRKDEVLLPDGETKLKHGDEVIIFGTEDDLALTMELLLPDGILARFKRTASRLISGMKRDRKQEGAETDAPGE